VAGPGTRIQQHSLSITCYVRLDGVLSYLRLGLYSTFATLKYKISFMHSSSKAQQAISLTNCVIGQQKRHHHSHFFRLLRHHPFQHSSPVFSQASLSSLVFRRASATMADSPPPTPPLRPPAAGEERFKKMGTPCEWIEYYRPGGYLPIHFGDIFKDGRYKVIRKLAWVHSRPCGSLMILGEFIPPYNARHSYLVWFIPY
jgi:hypothetical protein